MDTMLTMGIDFGGSASKATLLDANGAIVATSTREYRTYFTNNGWAEQDPEELYDALRYNVRAVLQGAGIDAARIGAIALDAATHTAILTDEDDKPVRRAIYWTDLRSEKQARWLRENHSNLIMEQSLNGASTAWTLPHLMWLRENEPEKFARVRHIYATKDYIRHRLTGDYMTDSIDAMGFMLTDERKGCWSPELCALAEIPSALLPEIVAPVDVVGIVSEAAGRETGLRPGTPVIAGASDTAMEVYASGAVSVGDATVKLATAGRICPITTGPIDSPHFFNYRHIIPGLWYPGTGTRSCAASYRWYRDVFCGHEAESAGQAGDVYQLMDLAAQPIPAGADGLCFHPYLQGEIAPHFDDALRGSFVGISSSHTKGHFNRAVLEGVAYSLRDCLELLRAHGVDLQMARIIGGGAKSALWSQILSDVLGISLQRTRANDSSLGSAMLAGVACGMFSSYEDSAEKCVEVVSIVHPDPKTAALYERGFRTYRKVHDALAEIYRLS